MREEALVAAQRFISVGGELLDKLQLQVAALMANEEENEDELASLQEEHDNLEIAISRVEDIIPDLEKT